MAEALPEEALQLICQLLSPEYVWEAAEAYGEGDPVKGAPQAALEIRKLIRKIVSAERGDRGRDLEMALLMRALGWPVWAGLKDTEWRLVPLEHEGWRELAQAFWPQGTPIHGGFELEVPEGLEYFDVYKTAIRATSRMLAYYPEMNRAVLNGKVYQRRDSYVMTHFEVRDDLRSMVMDCATRDDVWVEKKMRRGLRSAVKFSKSMMGKISTKLMVEWAKKGFLGSPAGAMISGCPSAPMGWGALVPANGIPLVVCVNKVVNGKCFIGITPDHRAFDGGGVSVLFDYLPLEMSRLLEVQAKVKLPDASTLLKEETGSACLTDRRK